MMEPLGNSVLEMQMMLLVFYLVLALVYFFLIIYEVVWERKWRQAIINIAAFIAAFFAAVWFNVRQSPNAVYGVIGVSEILYAAIQIRNMLREKKTHIQGNAIQESLDNLPSGAAFFDEQGMPVLINRQMYHICRCLSGRDIQSAAELREALTHPLENEVSYEPDFQVFCFSDGSVWKFSEDFIITESGEKFLQFLASEVSELYRNKQLLENENRKLQEMSEAMKELSKNIVALTREEEILAMKMKVHDDLGYSVLAAHRMLQQDSEINREAFLSQWSRVLSLLKRDNESERKVYHQVLQERANALGVKVSYTGEAVDDPKAAELMNIILLEALSNSARHAGATELYVHISNESNQMWVFEITNNGMRPDKEIEEGGGLSAIRRKIENANGTVEIRSFPEYSLTIKIPKNREGHI